MWLHGKDFNVKGFVECCEDFWKSEKRGANCPEQNVVLRLKVSDKEKFP